MTRRSGTGPEPAGGRPAPPIRLAYRPARPEDLRACTEIWSAGIGDYVRRLNQPWFEGDPEPLRRLLAHFLRTDPERFRVAVDQSAGDRVVGYASATLRGDAWFLGMLFVLPELHARGVGRTLLEQVMPRQTAADHDRIAMATAADSVQPVANALYSQYGMVPRLPIFNFVGRPERLQVLPGLPPGIRIAEWSADSTGADVEAASTIDTRVLGREHPLDHAFLMAEGRRRFIARSEQGEPVGYGYIAPSGRFGPVAALERRLLAPIAAHLITTVQARGAYATWVPGAADELFLMLLQAGFRFESFPALLLWDRPVADFSRYVPINLALL